MMMLYLYIPLSPSILRQSQDRFQSNLYYYPVFCVAGDDLAFFFSLFEPFDPLDFSNSSPNLNALWCDTSSYILIVMLLLVWVWIGRIEREMKLQIWWVSYTSAWIEDSSAMYMSLDMVCTSYLLSTSYAHISTVFRVWVSSLLLSSRFYSLLRPPLLLP